MSLALESLIDISNTNIEMVTVNWRSTHFQERGVVYISPDMTLQYMRQLYFSQCYNTITHGFGAIIIVHNIISYIYIFFIKIKSVKESVQIHVLVSL